MIQIELTNAQRQALQAENGKPAEVVDPATQQHYVLLAWEQYERVRALLESGEESEYRDAIVGIPPGILRSQQAFWRALPELLRNKRNHGRWAAFHLDELVGTARDDLELRREIKRRGVPRDDYYLGRIEPDAEPPWATIEVERLHACDIEERPPRIMKILDRLPYSINPAPPVAVRGQSIRVKAH
jgi:hypothetical protein